MLADLAERAATAVAPVAGTLSAFPERAVGGYYLDIDVDRAAVARYGRGGTYWDNGYPQEYGPDAVPLPIHAWQVWNEPNVPKYFLPSPSPAKYARLLANSRATVAS